MLWTTGPRFTYYKTHMTYHPFVNIAYAENTFLLLDLSTLANVVTTLALMGKQDGDQSDPNILSNGNQPEDINESVAKAFDTLTKVVQPIKAGSHDQVIN